MSQQLNKDLFLEKQKSYIKVHVHKMLMIHLSHKNLFEFQICDIFFTDILYLPWDINYPSNTVNAAHHNPGKSSSNVHLHNRGNDGEREKCTPR